MRRTAIYPGTFDPITKGHIDVIRRSAAIFDEVIVVIMDNAAKHCLFNETERLLMIQDACKDISNVKTDVSSGLSVHYAKEHGAQVMIRGIREVLDYEYELKTATANMWLAPEIETMFLLSRAEFAFLSSSAVKEIAMHTDRLEEFVTSLTAEKLKEKFHSHKEHE